MSISTNCKWVENGIHCCNPAIHTKSYCPSHHKRVYLTLPAEMADYIIEQELAADTNFTNSLNNYKLANKQITHTKTGN